MGVRAKAGDRGTNKLELINSLSQNSELVNTQMCLPVYRPGWWILTYPQSNAIHAFSVNDSYFTSLRPYTCWELASCETGQDSVSQTEVLKLSDIITIFHVRIYWIILSNCFRTENCQCQEKSEWKHQALCQKTIHMNLNKLKLWDSCAILRHRMERILSSSFHGYIRCWHIYFAVYTYEMSSLYKRMFILKQFIMNK